MQEHSKVQRRILAATSISYVVVILDTTVVNVALDRIGNDLAMGISGLQWVVNAYTLAFASLLLTGGASGDRWGAKRVYLAGLLLFTIASAVCGVAPNVEVLTGARVLQGLGAAMLVPCSLRLINQAFPDPNGRAAAIGYWAGFGGVAMAAGPLAGGILIALFGWRSIFLANVPIGLLGAWLTWRVSRDECSASAGHLDVSGQFTVVVALASLISVLIEGPSLGWHSPYVAGGLLASGMAWAAFLRIERRHTNGMLPLSLFKSRIVTGSTIVSLASALTFYGLLFMLSLYFQQVQGQTPLRTGLLFLPLTGAVAAGSLASGRLIKAYGTHWPVCAGLGCYIIGFLGLLSVTPTTPYWLVAILMPVIGFAAGVITPSTTTAAMNEIEKSRAGIAAGVLNSARQTGAALGVALFGAFLVLLPPFAAGMHAAAWVAASVSLVTLFAWAYLSHRVEAPSPQPPISGSLMRGE